MVPKSSFFLIGASVFLAEAGLPSGGRLPRCEEDPEERGGRSPRLLTTLGSAFLAAKLLLLLLGGSSFLLLLVAVVVLIWEGAEGDLE